MRLIVDYEETATLGRNYDVKHWNSLITKSKPPFSLRLVGKFYFECPG